MLRTTPSPTLNITATDKRLSVISSETDSSVSSGFCDINPQITEEEGSSSRGSVAVPEARAVSKQPLSPHGRRRKKSLDESSTRNSKDMNQEKGHNDKQNRSTTPDEEKKPSNFFRSFSLRDRSSSDRNDREKSPSLEQTPTSGVVLRQKAKDSNNGAHKRRSLIDRITHKYPDDRGKDKEKTRRRSLVDTTTKSIDDATSDERDHETGSANHKPAAKSRSNCFATEVSTCMG